LQYWCSHFKTWYVSVVVVVPMMLFVITWVLARTWDVRSNRLFWVSLAYRLVAGMCVGLVYRYYYSSNDTWLFFEEGKKLAALGRSGFMSYIQALVGNGDLTSLHLVHRDWRAISFVKIVSVFCLLGRDNYWLVAGYFSWVSFITSWWLHRAVTQIFSDAVIASALAFLFFPSVVFWASGIEKETLALSALYVLAAVALLTFKRKPVGWAPWALAIVATAVVWSLKYYWAGIFFASLTAWAFTLLLTHRVASLKSWAVLIWPVFFLVSGLVVSYLHPNFLMSRFLEVLVANHDAFARISPDERIIHFYRLAPTWSSVLLNAPWALWSGMFRPILGEGHGWLGTLASLENFFLLVLLGTALGRRRNDVNRLLLIAVVGYCVVLCIFLALSTPNLGSLSRYRVGFLPFFVFVIAYQNHVLKTLAGFGRRLFETIFAK